MYVELPLIETSTPNQRRQALKDAKEILSATPASKSGGIFGGGAATSSIQAPEVDDLLRVAEYITTGHEYKDTHPVGKRRPIIKQTTVNVHTVGEPTPADVEHFLSHVADGSFAQFMEEQLENMGLGNPEKEEGAKEEAHDWKPAREDEEAHKPQAEGDRPRFGF